MKYHSHTMRCSALIAALHFLNPSVTAQAQALDVGRVVDALNKVVAENFYDEELAYQTADRIAQRLDSGAYAGLDRNRLAAALTNDLCAIGKDQHYRVSFDPARYEYLRKHGSGESDLDAQLAKRAAVASNFGFSKVEVLDGNVGYLKLDEFNGEEEAIDKAHAVMAFLADSQALIIDLRDNDGGHASMELLLLSYFFPAEPSVLLGSFHYRKDDETRELWTHTDLPGRRFDGVPTFVLTSELTFSAAEAFAYRLAVRGRAIVVGQPTTGGANPINYFPLVDGFCANVAVARDVDEHSGTSFEGTGVTVDLRCPTNVAVEHAHLAALSARLEGCEDWERPALEWERDFKRAQVEPAEVDAERLAQYCGNYGGQLVELRDGALAVLFSGRSEWQQLFALTEACFVIPQVKDSKITFDGAGDARVVHIDFRDGRRRTIKRSS